VDQPQSCTDYFPLGQKTTLTRTEFRDKFSRTQGNTMQAREHIRSISYLKSHAAQISEDVAANGAPYIITQNGEAAMVIEGVRQYQDKEDLIALLKLLALGEKDRQAGLGLSVQEARAQLAQRRQSAKPQA
jgi:PHD/YefM family antitoxin component YafN of YafNO toxin-antitoxin module